MRMQESGRSAGRGKRNGSIRANDDYQQKPARNAQVLFYEAGIPRENAFKASPKRGKESTAVTESGPSLNEPPTKFQMKVKIRKCYVTEKMKIQEVRDEKVDVNISDFLFFGFLIIARTPGLGFGGDYVGRNCSKESPAAF